MELAIDTATEIASIALSCAGEVQAEMSWHAGQNHTVELIPNLIHLLNQAKIELKGIDAIIVAKGPGSFNGLRVGVGTAKGLAFVGATLYSVSPGAATLRVVDPADGSTLTSTSITLTGHSVDGATGLAAHPSTGELWALLKATPVDPPTAIRVLARLDPATGAATLVGDTGDRFAGIAFGAPESSPAPALSAPGLLLLAAGVLWLGSTQRRRATRSSSDS